MKWAQENDSRRVKTLTNPTKKKLFSPSQLLNRTRHNSTTQTKRKLKMEKNPTEGSKQTLKQADPTTNLWAPDCLHSWAPIGNKPTGSVWSPGWTAVVYSSERRKIKGEDMLPIQWYHLWQENWTWRVKAHMQPSYWTHSNAKISVCLQISNSRRKGKGN